MTTVTTKPYVKSKYRQAIIDAYKSTNQNIIVNAVPGSGKTTTLLDLVKETPFTSKLALLAFNRSIKEELERKVGLRKNTKISTIHGLGFSELYKYYRTKFKVTKNKNFFLFDHFMREHSGEKLWDLSEKEKYAKVFLLSNLIDTFKTHLCKDAQEAIELGLRFGIVTDELDAQRFRQFLAFVLKYDLNKYHKEKLISFVDMVYLPATLDIKPEKFDVILVDELQDLNVAQRTLVFKLMHPKTKIVGVGDINQAIYGFMGSDMDSFRKFTEIKNTKQMPLSVSYRCGSSIINFANTVYNTIEAAEDAEEGIVREGSINEVQINDFVLCRNNAPLFEFYIELLKRKVKAYIRGNEMGEILTHLIAPIESEAEAPSYFQHKLDDLEEKLKARKISKPFNHPAYRNLRENIATIEVLLKHFPTFTELKSVLKEMFIDGDEKKDAVLLSTIHKAKGLETDRVFLIKPELIPSAYAEEAWELIQERNLQYVAYTRAKKEFITITDF